MTRSKENLSGNQDHSIRLIDRRVELGEKAVRPACPMTGAADAGHPGFVLFLFCLTQKVF